MRNQVLHSETSRLLIQSFANGLKVLERFCRNGEALTLMDVARSLGCTKTTTYRYLVTLVSLGYLEMNEASRRYRLTVRVLNLGYAAPNALALPEYALPFLEHLSRRFDESANMAVLDGNEAVCVAHVGSERILTFHLHVGDRLPAYCTSLGKVLLAYLPEDERNKRLQSISYKNFTPNTITTQRDLCRILGAIRRQGYAVNDQELHLGLLSCAVPVFDKDGNPARRSICPLPAHVRPKKKPSRILFRHSEMPAGN